MQAFCGSVLHADMAALSKVAPLLFTEGVFRVFAYTLSLALIVTLGCLVMFGSTGMQSVSG